MTQIFIGTQNYDIRPLARRDARLWREKVQQTVSPLVDQVSSVISLDLQASGDLALLLTIVKQELPRLLSFPDVIWDLMLSYSPDLAADADELDATATDEQVMQAFIVALKQAYPLGGLMSLLGRAGPTTLPNSVGQNGALTASGGKQTSRGKNR